MAQNKTQQYIRTDDINKNIVASIDNGIIVLDDTLTIHHYNRWLELHTNLKESNLIHKKINDIFPEIKIQILSRKIKTALRMQTPTFYTANTSKYLIPIKINQLKNAYFEYMQQDVSIIPLDCKKNLVALILTDQTNMANTNALLKINIEKVKELNNELIKERETIDKKVLLIKITTDAVISDISHALLNLLQYEKDELYQLNFFNYEKLHMDKALKNSIVSSMQEIKVLKFEQKTLTKDGQELWMKSTLVPEYDSKGKHIGFIIFREDVTNEKLAAIHTNKLLSNSRSAAMGEMISMIAHQWRQPLSLITTILATIKIKHELNTLNTETMSISFNKIEQTVKYLSETIDDFRDYFKPNKILSNVNLHQLFNKSVSFLKEEMAQLEIEYNMKIDHEITITTYKNELLQSIINILKNSMDAFSENKINNKHINISLDKYTTHISIRIEDNAGGIESEVLKRVFEPYFSTKSKNGTGLGLYMCKTIIDEHLKGKITVTSENNSTVTLVELPYFIEERS
jgi:PAS domain S-box-containing protein